ncbi:MAG TPA: hypothetical protein VHP11_12545 [Tepidisphaeraceae bacterium]|nr:hypothetical protein [Tepidisphaeraceae bacterium]
MSGGGIQVKSRWGKLVMRGLVAASFLYVAVAFVFFPEQIKQPRDPQTGERRQLSVGERTFGALGCTLMGTAILTLFVNAMRDRGCTSSINSDDDPDSHRS